MCKINYDVVLCTSQGASSHSREEVAPWLTAQSKLHVVRVDKAPACGTCPGRIGKYKQDHLGEPPIPGLGSSESQDSIIFGNLSGGHRSKCVDQKLFK